MRMAFGLVGFLVVIGVIVWIMSSSTLPHTQQVLQTRKEVTPKAQQLGGKDADGTDVRQQIKLDAESTGGRMTAVLVTAIDAGGGMEKYFGLKQNDSIVEIGMGGGVMRPVKEMSDPAEAKDALLTAFQQGQQVVVVRDEKRLTLPANPGIGGGQISPPKGGATAPPPQQPAGATGSDTGGGGGGGGGGGTDTNSLQRQLQNIPGVAK
ncbi:MAG TPA: hypothetical protein VER17_01030 [Tepidisphaeraceae bacterium]|nr:hypothetical protein [Tepidisphaeraceae bacterium]